MKLKLRAWNGKELLSDFTINSDGNMIFANGEAIEVGDDLVLNIWTGKQDINQQDIYEDDILADGSQVVYDEDTLCFMKEDETGELDVLEDDEEVVGNVFQMYNRPVDITPLSDAEKMEKAAQFRKEFKEPDESLNDF